jgi:DNA-binding GntR family transcriptional regulator
MLEISAVLAAKSQHVDVLPELLTALEGYELAVHKQDWARAVEFDLQFHALLIRLHRNRRLESFYQKVSGELRMGMVLVDRGHDQPGKLIPVHRKLYQLLAKGKAKQCAALLAQHLQDSELRLSRVMSSQCSKANGRKQN